MENTEATDSGRKVVATLVGIVMIVLLVLTAKWTGDQIRNRLARPQPIAVVEQTPTGDLLGDETTKTATYSAIPATGPADLGYVLLGLSALTGFSSLALAKKAL